MALMKTDAVDAIAGGKTIATLDAGPHADNREAFDRITERWRDGVIAKAQRGDTSLTREQVMAIPKWRQSLRFRHVFLDGSKRIHKPTQESQRLEQHFSGIATKAAGLAIDAAVEHNKREHAELLRKNSGKYAAALEEIEREETAADRLRDKILSVKDPKRRAELREKFPELFERF